MAKTTDMFDEIEPSKKKSVKVAEQIIELIERGELSPGDKLPSEHELAGKMDVSRPSVREALSGLQALEIVDTKIGSGTYVSESILESTLVSADLSLMEKETSHLQIIEARKNLENAMLGIAINNLENEDLGRVEEVLARMKEHSTEKEYQQYMDADHDFHEALVKLTGNPLVLEAAQPLLATINDSLYRELTHKYYLVDDSRIRRCFNIHKDLYRSVKEKDLKKAKDSIARHWELMENALEKENN
ncbi:MAG: FadR/GntR family transcriptional regulator [Candidatus Acetothermia bacterium]